MLLAAVVAVGLVACTPDDDPSDPDTPTGSTSTSTSTEEPTTDAGPSPTDDVPTPPDLDQPTPPEEMGVDDRAGAAAAAEYYLRLLEYSQTTGDTRQLEQMSAGDCSFCQSRLDDIEETHTTGGWIENTGFALDDIRVQFYEDGYLVRFSLDVPEATVHDGSGGTRTIVGEALPDFGVYVIFSAGGFTVAGASGDTDA